MVKVKRFDVCLIKLDPAIGSEIQKTRPCLIVSPDSMNFSRLKTIIVAPMTSKIRDNFPTRITLNFQGKQGQVVLDQIRTVDRARIVKVLGAIDDCYKNEVLCTLNTMFK